MLARKEKPITEAQYKRAIARGGYLDPADMDEIFTDVEQYDYGIYDVMVYPKHNNETKEVAYIVQYVTSTNCD